MLWEKLENTSHILLSGARALMLEPCLKQNQLGSVAHNIKQKGTWDQVEFPNRDYSGIPLDPIFPSKGDYMGSSGLLREKTKTALLHEKKYQIFFVGGVLQ